MSIVIDTPAGIEAYRRLATLHGLRLEVRGIMGPTRGMAYASAKRLLAAEGKLPAGRLTRKRVLVEFEILMGAPASGTRCHEREHADA